jgi:hypothetical protein
MDRMKTRLRNGQQQYSKQFYEGTGLASAAMSIVFWIRDNDGRSGMENFTQVA